MQDIFTPQEKAYLKNPQKIPLKQRGSYKKRIMERLKELDSIEFKKALEFLSIEEKVKLWKIIFEQFPIPLARYLIGEYKKLFENVNVAPEKILEFTLDIKKKENKISSIIGRKIDSGIFWEILPFVNKLSKKELRKKIRILENNRKNVLTEKKLGDIDYFRRNNKAKKMLTHFKKSKKIKLNEIKEEKGTYFRGFYKIYFTKICKHLVERGILSCQKTQKLNFLSSTRKKLQELKKIKVRKKTSKRGRFIPFSFYHYDILPFENKCKNCKEKCIWEINEYGKTLNL